MAGFARVNGDLLPVANYDAPTYTNSGVDAVQDAAVVQPQGPKLDFFTITKDTGAFTGVQVTTILRTLEQLATIHIYEYVDDANDTVAVALYPTAAWTAATIDTAVTAAGIAVTVADGATFGA